MIHNAPRSKSAPSRFMSGVAGLSGASRGGREPGERGRPRAHPAARGGAGLAGAGRAP